jgi:hypothetical protein
MSKKVEVEKHYERRLIEAKGEMLKDAGPVVDFFVSMHEQCKAIAEKNNIDAGQLTKWLLEQLPIEALCTGESEDDDEDEVEDEEYEEEAED